MKKLRRGAVLEKGLSQGERNELRRVANNLDKMTKAKLARQEKSKA